MKRRHLLFPATLVLGLCSLLLHPAGTGEENPTTLLPPKILDAVISHTSGDMPYQFIRRISLFNRLAASEAYHGAAEYILGELKKYGLADALIEQYPADGKTWYYMFKSFYGWDGESGTVWMTNPHREKICDFAEMPACLCRWSNSAHVAGELVDVGEGRPEDFKGIDVKNKVVLTSNDPSSVHEEAVFNRGALGVISYFYPRPVDYPDAVERSGIGHYETSTGQKSTFAFKISHRKGLELLDLLRSGQKVTVKVDVEGRNYASQYEDVIATIPGTDPDAGEFLCTAHLCHFDPGADDNASGAASILEIARAIRELITSGEIPPLRRTIRFIWVPEMSGSYAYAATHPDKTNNMICGLNLDMVGSYLNRLNSGFNFHCTPASLPHFINDVVANFADFVGTTNTEDDYYSAYHFPRPILSPQGSRDSFRYKILPFMGGSDHKIYNDQLVHVPMVFFNVWPDPYYESNMDSPDKCDPTTMRREAVVAVASAVFVANAGAPEALQLATEVYSRGLGRLSRDIKKGFEYLNMADKAGLATAYKEADNVVRRSVIREKAAVSSIVELAPKDVGLSRYIGEVRAGLDSREKTALRDVWNHYRALCEQNGLKPEVPALDPEERAARKIIPVRNQKLKGPLGTRYVSERTGKSLLAGVSPALRDERVLYEVFNFIDGRNSVLDIRNAASAEYSPLPLQDIKKMLDILGEAGVISLGPASPKR
jgi:aminopeptidase YwaD